MFALSGGFNRLLNGETMDLYQAAISEKTPGFLKRSCIVKYSFRDQMIDFSE
jgi:hypothetical protein